MNSRRCCRLLHIVIAVCLHLANATTEAGDSSTAHGGAMDSVTPAPGVPEPAESTGVSTTEVTTEAPDVTTEAPVVTTEVSSTTAVQPVLTPEGKLLSQYELNVIASPPLFLLCNTFRFVCPLWSCPLMHSTCFHKQNKTFSSEFLQHNFSKQLCGIVYCHFSLVLWDKLTNMSLFPLFSRLSLWFNPWFLWHWLLLWHSWLWCC